MPSRKELREELTILTHESFVSGIPLAKTNYSDADANRIYLQALISYHSLMHADELLSKINASKTNVSCDTVRAHMRSIYQDALHHNHATYNYVCAVNKALGERTSIGRNQMIKVLLDTAIASTSDV